MFARTADNATTLAHRVSRFALAFLVCLPGGLCLCAEAQAAPAMARADGAGCCGETAAAGESGLSLEPAAAQGCCADGCAMMSGEQPAESKAAAIPAIDRDGAAEALCVMTAEAATAQAHGRIQSVVNSPPTLPAPGHIALGVIVR